MSRVLLIEDNRRLAELVGGALRRVGIATDEFGDIEAARQVIGAGDYALLILDRGLPDGDGIDFLREIRAARKRIPCLVLTARDAVHDRVAGLESGADDYLSKPFSIDELVARVRALLRRPENVEALERQFGDLVLAEDGTTLTCGNAVAVVAVAEAQILGALMAGGGRTIRRASLEHAAWGLGEPVTLNALDVAIHRLRKKLRTLGSSVYIVNMKGVGFAMKGGEPDESAP